MTDQSPDPAASATGASAKSKPQPTKKLPSNRINPGKQLNLIRAFGVFGANGATVKLDVAAKTAEMAENTAALLIPFLVENDFLSRVGTGEFTAAQPIIDFARAYSWSPETASAKLAPLVSGTWFGAKLLSLLSFRPMGVDQAVHELAAHVAATPEYRDQIELLVDYAEWAGIVRREGNQLFLGDVGREGAPQAAAAPTPAREEPARTAPPPPPSATTGTIPSGGAAVATGFSSTQGGIQFHVGLRVDMAEMANWSPDRIAAFFAGVAQVLAAKHGIEEVSDR